MRMEGGATRRGYARRTKPGETVRWCAIVGLLISTCRGGLVALGCIGMAIVAGRSQSAQGAEPKKLERYEFTEVHMGAEIRVVLYSADAATANRASRAAYERIAALNKILSDYDPKSELSSLSATAGSGRTVPIGNDLFVVLDRSQKLAAATDGAFDVTVGPLVKAWRSARRTKTFPSDERLEKARAAVGYRNLVLDESAHTAQLLRPDMLLDLGGIGMGYAADEALKVLRANDVAIAMIDASGDVACGDAPPGRDGWRIGIAPLTESKGPPSRYVTLKNAALTTSGDAFQFVEIDGKRYSHIVDPHTGLGLTTRMSVTVVAGDCTTADSLATAVSVLGPERGLKLIEETPGAAALIVRAEVGGIQTEQSKSFVSDPATE
ncbi:MAG: FAD:protein FMN transferase [Pirellulales bacterium]